MQCGNKPSGSQIESLYSILRKISSNFGLASDISSCKRTFYSILDAGRSARDLQLRNKPGDSKFATIYCIFPKINRYFGTF